MRAMTYYRWLLATSVAVAGLILGAPARAATIRDEGKMFSARAVERAQAELGNLERRTRIPVVIETIEALTGLGQRASHDEKLRAINQAAKRRDSEIRDEGIYILLSKSDRVISEPLVRARLDRIVPIDKRHAIRQAFIDEF